MNPSWLRSTLWISTLTILAALAGVALGVHLTLGPFGHHFGRMGREGREGLHERLLARLDRELQLSPVQHQQVDSLFAEQNRRILRLRVVIEPLFKARQDSLEAGLRQVLRPDQVEKLERLHRQMSMHPQGFLRRHGGGMGMGHFWEERGEQPGPEDTAGNPEESPRSGNPR